ncbi:MAG: ABC transporter ATP-binding protein [Proteobacteria bacterium]|nr:ABC transporter ATP-binding protein [Pseudomonadota bacterium]
MIRLIHLSKQYNSLVAVNDVSLEVFSGEIFGFLGPNGAGKTTTIRMIAGLLKPTSGSIVIDQWDLSQHPVEAKKITGFIPDRPFIYGKLTGREFLRFIGGLYSLPPDQTEERIRQFLDLFNLESWGDELVEGFSHGMKQRLVMASALIHRPRVIIVDEPMVGLDPAGAKLVKRIFKGLCRSGVTIFMSTHTLEIAEEMCDRIGIIQEGKLIAVGTMKELRESSGTEGKKLESIFFKLTGEEEMTEVIEALRF